MCNVYINFGTHEFKVKSVSLKRAAAYNIVNKFACSSFSVWKFSQSIFVFVFFIKWTIKISRGCRKAVRKREFLVCFLLFMINFFRKNERHCFTLGVVKNYFPHLFILLMYFSKLSHFYNGRSPSVMHSSNRLNCTLFYFHPRMHWNMPRVSLKMDSVEW